MVNNKEKIKYRKHVHYAILYFLLTNYRIVIIILVLKKLYRRFLRLSGRLKLLIDSYPESCRLLSAFTLQAKTKTCLTKWKTNDDTIESTRLNSSPVFVDKNFLVRSRSCFTDGGKSSLDPFYLRIIDNVDTTKQSTEM